ncbi:MAG TPA: HD domain-containing protein, partial [Chitinophagaceae bacterium]|nr:HD domain-containing protein [Chitinophagaceae bacterium]
MQYQLVYNFLMPKLEEELPEYYTYHNAAHTKSVIAAAEYLGTLEKISEEEMLLLKTAALFHDAGFLQQADGHEEISCILARDHLPEFGYSEKHIGEISRIIMA